MSTTRLLAPFTFRPLLLEGETEPRKAP